MNSKKKGKHDAMSKVRIEAFKQKLYNSNLGDNF